MKIQVAAIVNVEMVFEYDVPESFLEEWLMENGIDNINDLTEEERLALADDIFNIFEYDDIVEEEWVDSPIMTDINID